MKCQSKCEDAQCVDAKSCESLESCAGEISCCDAIAVDPKTYELVYAVPEVFGDKPGDSVKRVTRTLRPYALDRFEVTVGRFIAFVGDYDSARKPPTGAGKHPAFPDSGWQEHWSDSNGMMPVTIGSLVQGLRARGELLNLGDDPNRPVRGLSWYLASAFCIWDGGRLPTEAEWVYAASSGQDREYPWPDEGTPPITHERAVYAGDGSAITQPSPVGTHSPGHGPLGHEDLAGNVLEWNADVYRESLPTNCGQPTSARIDEYECLQQGDENAGRVLRGGAYDNDASALRNVHRRYQTPSDAANDYGARCARDLFVSGE